MVGSKKNKYDIFISYRREGGDTQARLLYERLVEKGYRVFLDIESLRSGKFNEELLQVIEGCSDIIVILPPGAMERCNNSGDWLYQELMHGMKCKKNIIPVMMKGFQWTEDIPEELKVVEKYNGIIDSKDYFDAVIEKLISLLQSKPGVFIKKRNDTGKKYILAVAIFLFLCGIGYGLFTLCNYEDKKEQEKNVSIQLTAGKEMSASEYYDAIVIIKKRLDIFAEGVKYEINITDNRIQIEMPLDLFEEKSVKDMLCSYISRPTELSINSEIPIDRADITDLEIVNDENGNHMEITFSDDLNNKIDSIYGTDGSNLELVQDKQFASYYSYNLSPTEKENTYKFEDNNKKIRFYELCKFNYTNETFSDAFSYNYLMPVIWEEVDTAEVKGENQKNETSLSQGQTTVQYMEGWYGKEDELNNGEWKDTIAEFKRRLDILDIPYAFGYTVGENYGISVKIATDKVNDILMEMVGQKNTLDINSAFYEMASLCDMDKLEYASLENGLYQFILEGDKNWYEYKKDEWNRAVDGIRAKGNDKSIYVENEDTGRVYCRGELPEETDSIEGIKFTSLDVFGLSQIDDSHLYLLKFMKDFVENDKFPSKTYYTVEGIRKDDLEAEWGLSVILNPSQEERADMEKQITELCPAAEVYWKDSKLTVFLNKEIDNSLPEKANTLIQKIYNICNLSTGKIRECAIFYNDAEENLVSCLFQRDQFATHGIRYKIYCQGPEADSYSEALNKVVEADRFYQTEVRPAENSL